MSREETHFPTHCTFCQGKLVPPPTEWGLPGKSCQSCRRYYPSPEECAETRSMFLRWRHLLLVIATFTIRVMNSPVSFRGSKIPQAGATGIASSLQPR